MNPTPEEVAAYMRSLGFEASYGAWHNNKEGIYKVPNEAATFFYQQAHKSHIAAGNKMETTPVAPPTGDMEELRAMLATLNNSGAHACYCPRSEDNGCTCALKDEYVKEIEATVLALKSEWERSARLLLINQIRGNEDWPLSEQYFRQGEWVGDSLLDAFDAEEEALKAALQTPQKGNN